MGILNQTEETVAPTNPDALRRLLYPKSSGWIDRDSTGAEKQLSTLTGVETLSNKTLVSPALGTPTSGVATNLTGTAAGLTAGNATTNANLTGPVTSVGNATAIADAALSIAKTSGLQAAIDLKSPLASPTFTGTVTVPAPTNATDAATKGYADALKQALDIKDSVRVASTVNIAVATALVNASTIDGVVVATGDRVLLKDQTAPAENGIYVVVASGAAPRSTDADASSEVTTGMYTFVSEGTASAGTGFVLTTADPITLGTTALSLTAFSGAGQVIAGNGLTETGNTLSINTAVTVDLSTGQTLSNKTLVAPSLGAATCTTMTATDNLICSVVGKGLQVKTGAGARAGNATLVAGTIAVSNTTVTANTVAILTRKAAGGTIGDLTYALAAGTSFTINSANALDTSTVSYFLIEVNA